MKNKYCIYCVKFIEYPKKNNCGSQNCLRLAKQEENKRNHNYIGKKLKERERKLTQKIKVNIRNCDRSIRKENICLMCGKEVKTNNHHISYIPSILIELCNKCHDNLHKNYIKLKFVRGV